VASPLSVLVVDDQPEVCEALSIIVEAEGHFARSCRSGVEALQAIRHMPKPFDLLITDHFMPGSYTGLDLVRIIRTQGYRQQIIVTSGGFTDELKASYEKFGVLGFLPKPINFEVLRLFLVNVALVPTWQEKVHRDLRDKCENVNPTRGAAL
jgi:CheY-like chemotaxis protein